METKKQTSSPQPKAGWGGLVAEAANNKSTFTVVSEERIDSAIARDVKSAIVKKGNGDYSVVVITLKSGGFIKRALDYECGACPGDELVPSSLVLVTKENSDGDTRQYLRGRVK